MSALIFIVLLLHPLRERVHGAVFLWYNQGNMKTSPEQEEIKNWLVEYNPLGVFDEGVDIEDIDPKPWSGHFNFWVAGGGRELVLRFRGPEWGEPEGIRNEYKILKKIGVEEVGPKVYYLSEDFFGEHAILMEYLEGEVFPSLNDSDKNEFFGQIAVFISGINKIPFEKSSFPFGESMENYDRNRNSWRERAAEIKRHPDLFNIGREIENLIPDLEKKLDEFEPVLQTAIERYGSCFIFESAHAGHLLKVEDGFRFLNWEKVSYGDPSFTLAVFLTSMKNREDFADIKKEMIDVYLRENPIEDFGELLDQRLWERDVSNAIYRIWTSARREAEVDLSEMKKHIEELASYVN